MSHEIKEGRLVGVIGKSFGLKGELYVRLVTDYPNSIKEGAYLYLDPELTSRIRVEKKRVSGKKDRQRVILKLYGYDSIDDAIKLSGLNLYRDPYDSPKLEKDQFWLDEIEGISVKLKGKRQVIGHVKDVLQYTSNDIIVIEEHDGKEHYVPFIKEYIYEIDDKKNILILKKYPDYY